MSSVATNYEHVVLDAAGVPAIKGTTIKVVELVTEQLAYGWSPEEVHFQHPHLTLGQIHSTLAYYWDHKDQLDEDLERRLSRVERVRKEIPAPSLRSRLTPGGSH